MALIIAFRTAVMARERAAALASLVVGCLASVLPGTVRGRPPSLAFALGLLAWLIVLLCAAELLRARRQRVIERAQARDDELARRAMASRLAIAREVHDVVAHNISVINVQANTALHLMDRQPERAGQALTTIHEVSRQALTELRSVLGVLRTGELAPLLAPGPGIGDLPGLVARASAAGPAVQLSHRGDQRPLPAEVSLTAYRIVQEALTNSARHAPGSEARVTIGYLDQAVTVEIEDNGPAAGLVAAPHVHDQHAGDGIAGMTERAQALGGTLDAGPVPGRGFLVTAWLPAPGGAGAP